MVEALLALVALGVGFWLGYNKAMADTMLDDALFEPEEFPESYGIYLGSCRRELDMEIEQSLRPVAKGAVDTWAAEIHHEFTVSTLEGLVRGKRGDFLMVDMDGDFYVCDRDKFMRSYCWINND